MQRHPPTSNLGGSNAHIETGHATKFADDPPLVPNGCDMIATGRFADHKLLSHERHDEPVPSTIAELASALAKGAGIEEVLTKLTLASLALVPSADYAKISTIDNCGLFSVAATSKLTTSLDSAQQAARQGPCLEAISVRKIIRCDDLATDARWPRFARHATTVGVHSVLSCPIDIPGDTGATLSLFGVRAEAFGAQSETVGAMLANHAAIVLVHDKHKRQFRAALATRDIIGQAKGIVMARFGVDATRAFGMLAAISRDTNTPVRELAARLANSATQ
jgi:transcriptional regulator with GAF, ATPase, and Fis domain